jgi:hypothetical protein
MRELQKILPPVALRLSGRQHAALAEHLFPGDGCEAVALVLCGRALRENRHALTAYEVHPVPHEACTERTPVRVSWPTSAAEGVLRRAAERGLAVVKVHSHPTGHAAFSETDDASDGDLFPSVMGWTDDPGPHGSAVMLPDGRMFARAAYDDGRGDVQFVPVERVTVAGDDISAWFHDEVCGTSAGSENVPEFARRHAQAFGAGTTALLRRLSVAVVGCSGTGSPVVEMLARLGVGELVLVDPDVVEEKNLNRIVNATRADADAERPKVEVLAEAVRRMGLGTRVVPLTASLFDPAVVRRVSACDVVVGCVDTVDGRDLLNRLAAYYLIPYVDVGVRLDADGSGGVDGINGTVQYLQPGGSSLMSRGAITPEALTAATLRRTAPEAYADLRREKYVLGVEEDRPAVVSVNTYFAAMAVNELLARLHPYRIEANKAFATYRANLVQARLLQEPEGPPCPALAPKAGRGDTRPLLGVPELSERARPVRGDRANESRRAA